MKIGRDRPPADWQRSQLNNSELKTLPPSHLPLFSLSHLRTSDFGLPTPNSKLQLFKPNPNKQFKLLIFNQIKIGLKNILHNVLILYRYFFHLIQESGKLKGEVKSA